MINTVHWNEPDEAKAHVLRIASEQAAEEQRVAPAGQFDCSKRDAAERLEHAIREADDATLARFCDVLKGN